jgi:hypothetical protein
MKTQKYYTPTIEEFYTELEHEIEANGRWLDLSFAKNILVKDSNKECLEGNISTNRIRVKCLDEQDILDLGWIKKKEEWYEIENKDKDAEITKYRLLFSLYELTENDYHTELFVDIKLGDIEIIVIPLGIRNIKNKSELNKIMQMLNIK